MSHHRYRTTLPIHYISQYLFLPLSTHSQQQKALDEFDFLYKIDQPKSKTQNRQSPIPPASPTSAANLPTSTSRSTSSLPQERPYVTQSSEVCHRPVLSMPPVILMGGGGDSGVEGSPGFASLFGSKSVPPSPIIEMPPSPAPSHMMVVEFPDDDEDQPDDVMGVHLHDDYRSQMVLEVRIQSQDISSYARSAPASPDSH